jgi:2-methylisocitrate lyase-like PEP mutase family enzyme
MRRAAYRVAATPGLPKAAEAASTRHGTRLPRPRLRPMVSREEQQMSNQSKKAEQLGRLHQGPKAFVIANAWDAGSARILAGLGFPALATSSAAAAATFGRRDGELTRAEVLANCEAIVAATDLPVSADLAKGHADDPAGVAETIRLAAATGLVGASIEDATGDPEHPIFELELAERRIRAAVSAARELAFPFTLVARAENFLHGRADLGDTIERLKAFERAGADVLFAPGLPDLAAVRAVCAAVTKPVNFMVGIRNRSFSVAELEQAGVRRISLSTSLYRAAMSGLVTAAREVKERGTFGYLDASLPSPELAAFMAPAAP